MTTTELLARACARLARRCARLTDTIDGMKRTVAAHIAKSSEMGRQRDKAEAALADMTAKCEVVERDRTAVAKASDIQTAKVNRLSEDCGKAVAEVQRLRAELGDEAGWRLADDEAKRKLKEMTWKRYEAEQQRDAEKSRADAAESERDAEKAMAETAALSLKQMVASRDAEKARADAAELLAKQMTEHAARLGDDVQAARERADAAQREVERLTIALAECGRKGGAAVGRWDEQRAEADRLRADNEWLRGIIGLAKSAADRNAPSWQIAGILREADAPPAPHNPLAVSDAVRREQGIVDAPPAAAKPRRMKGNPSAGAACYRHRVEHDEDETCRVYPPCEPADAPPSNAGVLGPASAGK